MTARGSAVTGLSDYELHGLRVSAFRAEGRLPAGTSGVLDAGIHAWLHFRESEGGVVVSFGRSRAGQAEVSGRGSALGAP
eukprot:7127934-Pyramimonas_sp.AAC.1